jgi:hypothetical protein
MSARWLVLLLGAGCATPTPDVTLAVRQPVGGALFASVQQLEVLVNRDGRPLAQSTFAPTQGRLSLSGVSYGKDTVFTLEGVASGGDVVASGSSCPIDFEARSPSTPLYFAPTHLFATTPGAPPTVRTAQMPIALPDGDTLFVGGIERGAAVADVTRFVQASATFVEAGMSLSTPRAGAEVSPLSTGALITGGVDASGVSQATAELYLAETGQLTPIANQALGARSAHRAITLGSDRVLATGGWDDAMNALATTAAIVVESDGSVLVAAGPPLQQARAAHAAVVAVGTPVVIGGYDTNHAPLSSIEALSIADDGQLGTFRTITQLTYARAEATATLLGDGSILIVGGIGSDGKPVADAEVYNPVTQQTRLYALGTARSGHTATLLPDGSVLILGGIDASGLPIATTELFIVDLGFVSEQPLVAPRTGHLAVPQCDGSILIEGGAADAEVYVPSPT